MGELLLPCEVTTIQIFGTAYWKEALKLSVLIDLDLFYVQEDKLSKYMKL